MDAELLVVEDSDDDYEVFELACHDAGFRGAITRFRDGDQALAHFRSAPFSIPRTKRLVVLDLNLPGMDGRQLLTELKCDPTLRTMPVVVYTTSANSRDVEFCYFNYANAYQVKPMDLDALQQGVRSMLSYWLGAIEHA